MKHIKNFNSFINENLENIDTKIPIVFSYNGVNYNFVLDTVDEGADFWTCFYGEDVNGNDISFDVHYCEDYNEIYVYEIDMNTLETNHNKTIHKQPIFSEEEYKRKKQNFIDSMDSTEYYNDDEDEKYL